MSIPPPCDPEVFRSGKALLAADTSRCGAQDFEVWVQEIARLSGQRVDWHYSGGIASVLFLGDREKALAAILLTPCPAHIMRVFEIGDPGLFRQGVSQAPPGALAAYYEGGRGSTYIVDEATPPAAPGSQP